MTVSLRFSKTRQNGQYIQNVSIARFARNVEWDLLLWFSNIVNFSAKKWMVESIKLLFFYRTIWSSNPDRWAKHVKTNFWRPRFCLTAGAVVTLYVTIYMIACDVVVQCSLNWRPWGWDGGGLRCSRIRRRPITIAATLKFETVEKRTRSNFDFFNLPFWWLFFLVVSSRV